VQKIVTRQVPVPYEVCVPERIQVPVPHEVSTYRDVPVPHEVPKQVQVPYPVEQICTCDVPYPVEQICEICEKVVQVPREVRVTTLTDRCASEYFPLERTATGAGNFSARLGVADSQNRIFTERGMQTDMEDVFREREWSQKFRVLNVQWKEQFAGQEQRYQRKFLRLEQQMNEQTNVLEAEKEKAARLQKIIVLQQVDLEALQRRVKFTETRLQEWDDWWEIERERDYFSLARCGDGEVEGNSVGSETKKYVSNVVSFSVTGLQNSERGLEQSVPATLAQNSVLFASPFSFSQSCKEKGSEQTGLSGEWKEGGKLGNEEEDKSAEAEAVVLDEKVYAS
jgi:hypothetical protein